MTTVVGDFAVNFVPLSNVNPYTNPSLTYQTADTNQVLSNVCKPSTLGGGDTTHLYNSAMAGGATIRAKIEVGANPGSSDFIYLYIQKSGTQVYRAALTGTSLQLGDFIAGSNVFTGTITAPASGDQCVLEYVPGTRLLSFYVNGTSVASATITSTVQTGLTFGYGMEGGGANNATIKSFAGDGIAVATTFPPVPNSMVFQNQLASILVR